jgi:hypothetical protein
MRTLDLVQTRYKIDAAYGLGPKESPLVIRRLKIEALLKQDFDWFEESTVISQPVIIVVADPSSRAL